METAFANLPSDPAALRAIILAQALELAAREAELRSHGTLIEKLKAQLEACGQEAMGQRAMVIARRLEAHQDRTPIALRSSTSRS